MLRKRCTLCKLSCNALLHSAPTGTIQTLQRVQNNAARVVLQVPRRSDAKTLLHRLYWLPIKHRLLYKMAVTTFKVRQTSTPAYLSRYIKPRDCARQLRSSDTSLLAQLTIKTFFSERGFRLSAPAVWHSLPRTVLYSPSLTVFRSRLKTHIFHTA